MTKAKKVTIFKTAGISVTFAIGDEINYTVGDKLTPSGKKVQDIRIGFFGTVKMLLSDGSQLCFKNASIEYEV